MGDGWLSKVGLQYDERNHFLKRALQAIEKELHKDNFPWQSKKSVIKGLFDSVFSRLSTWQCEVHGGVEGEKVWASYRLFRAGDDTLSAFIGDHLQFFEYDSTSYWKQRRSELLTFLESALEVTLANPQPKRVKVETDMCWDSRFLFDEEHTEVGYEEWWDAPTLSPPSEAATLDCPRTAPPTTPFELATEENPPCYRFFHKHTQWFDFSLQFPYYAKVVTTYGPFQYEMVKEDGEWARNYDWEEQEDYSPDQVVFLVSKATYQRGLY